MAARGLERGRRERFGKDRRRPLGRLDRVDDRGLDRRHGGSEKLPDRDGARPIRGIRREQGVDERRRLRRCVRHVGEQRRRRLVRAPEPDSQPVVALERGAPRQQPEEQAAERVHVGGGLAVRAPGLLGRPVLRGPEQHALGRDAGRRAGDPREAEVGDDDAAGGALDQDVAGSEVAMHDPARMGVGERGRNRERDLGSLRPAEHAVACDVAEVRSLDELHHEKRCLTVLAVVVEAHDVLVLEGSENPRLACESTPKLEIFGDPRVEQLDRDVTAQAPVAGAPDRAHPTFADASAKLVAAGDEVGHMCEGGHGRVSRGRTRGKM